jgi:CHAT domain-containing protein
MITELVPGDADGHGMLGWALILQGKLREARETCRKSFRLGPQNYAWVLNLGHTYLLLGESRSAYIFYKTALTLIKTKKELQEGPLADFSLFIAQNRQVNACKKARFWFESSFPKLQEARKLQNGYNKLFLEGKYSQAISLAKKNYEFTNEIFGDKHPVVATSMNDLAKLLRASGRYIDAEPLIKKTLEIRRQLFGDEHPDVGASMNNLAALYYETDRIPESGILLKRALGIAQQAGEPELLYYSQKAFCVVLGASSKTEAAIFFGKQAVNTIQRMRRNVASLEKESRKRFLRTKEYAYKDLSELLIDQGRLAEAAQVLAMLKDEVVARNLKNLTALQSTLKKLGHGAVLVHFIMLEDKLRILVTTPHVQLARQHPIGEKALNDKIFSFRDTINNPKSDPLPLAQELYGCLLKPVIDDLRQAGAGTLMVSLDGALRYLPVAALHDGTRYLAEEFQLVIFTEAARDKLKDPATTTWRVAGLGLTKAIPGFSALPAVQDELEGIVRENDSDKDGVLAGTILLNEEFTTRALQDALMEAYPVLHIASHFDFRPGNESLSNLILGDGTRLSLSEIRNTYDFPNVDLITLSAGNTAMGSNAKGSEIEGFGAMVQNKGAKGVLATLWPVADRSTGLFMKTMYALRTAEQLTKAEALQKTQIRFIRGLAGHETGVLKEKRIGYASGKLDVTPANETGKDAAYSHPFYWAPFILMGNWL